MSEVAVLVLTEDSSKWAFATLEQVCRHIFNLITPQVETGDWLSFAPATAAGREAMTSNMWKSKQPRDQHKILRLCRDIATHLLRDDGLVCFHFDGDTTWTSGKSENLERFEEVIRAKVRAIVRGELNDQLDARVDYVMSKLVHVAPFYSIETWLFANVARLRKLGANEAILTEWEEDLAKLDAIEQPKRLVRVSPRDYPELARDLNAAALYQLESSFCATVNRTGASASLVVRLRQHWPTWIRAQYGLD